MTRHFALPLFALVDRHKIDPDTSDLLGLSQQIGHYLLHNFSIEHGGVSIEGVHGAGGTVDLYLVITEVSQESWPALFALADVQKTRLLLCEFPDDGTGRFVLTPLESAE
ncbi:MAG: hypothetical protein LBV54_04025 [Puniceicoccales bacterium]|jgi:hypothetical protein|nr:hypothetical protein [Puniceicoccales bacterium]